MRIPIHFRRAARIVLSTDPRRRIIVAMALLALVLMTASAAVMLLLTFSVPSVDRTAVQWWAGISVGGLAVMTVLIRSGATARLSDPSITIAQMVWSITSGAVAYVLAGEARGVVPSVLAMILFFGTFGLTMAQVIGTGLYALIAFATAVIATPRFNASYDGMLDTAYALMVLIVLVGCIALSLRIQHIRERLRQHREALAMALAENRELATRDPLTGLLNRRAMLDLMRLELRRNLRNGRSMVLAQLDIDHFKHVNDTHGHAIGDRTLQAFAQAVRANVRGTDVLSRWGGEEFVLMLCDTRPEAAHDLMERVRLAVAAMHVPQGPADLRITVSTGIALHLTGESIEQTLERADQALYAAKDLGRDRVVIAAEQNTAILPASTPEN